MRNTPVYTTVIVSGFPISQDSALAELDNPEDISSNLTSIAQDYADTQGIQAEISIFYEPDQTPGYQIIAVGPSHPDEEIRDISDQMTQYMLSECFNTSNDTSTRSEDSISHESDHPFHGHYFAGQLQVEHKDLSNDGILIASDTVSGAENAAETYIGDAVNAGDFYYEEDKETMDGSYAITDQYGKKIADKTFSMAGDRLGFQFVVKESQRSSVDHSDDLAQDITD